MIELEIDITAQYMLFVFSLILGVILGILYDIFEVIRWFFRSGGLSAFILDVFYFVVSAFFTFLFMIVFSKGIIRFYPILGIIIGFWIYNLIVGNLFISVIKHIIRAAGKVFSRIKGCILAVAILLKNKIVSLLCVVRKITFLKKNN